MLRSVELPVLGREEDGEPDGRGLPEPLVVCWPPEWVARIGGCSSRSQAVVDAVAPVVAIAGRGELIGEATSTSLPSLSLAPSPGLVPHATTSRPLERFGLADSMTQVRRCPSTRRTGL